MLPILIIFKCTIQWDYVYIQFCVTISTVSRAYFFIFYFLSFTRIECLRIKREKYMTLL